MGATAPPRRLPGDQRAQLSLMGKDKHRSAFPLTLRDRQSILPSRASPPLCVAVPLMSIVTLVIHVWAICHRVGAWAAAL